MINLRMQFAALGILVVAFLLAPNPARAQAPDTTGLSLDEAVQIALKQNLSLKQSENQVVLDSVAVREAKSNFYPNLSISSSPLSERFGRSFDTNVGRLVTRRTESLSASISSSVNLFNGFSDVATLAGSRKDLEAGLSSLERSRQDLIFQTTTQFIQAILNQELIRIQKENLEAQKQQLELIEAFYKAGSRPLSDVLQQRATTAQADLQLLTAQHDFEVSKLTLKQTLHLNLQKKVQLQTPSTKGLAEKLPENSSDQMVVEALKDRPDYRAQQVKIESAREQLRVARSGYWPTLSLGVGGSSSYSSLNTAGGFSKQFFDLNRNASIGLSLSIPLFDRNRTRYSVQRAQVALENAQLSLQTIRQQVETQVQQALLDYGTAAKKLDVTNTQLEAAKEALAAAEERYKVGASTLVELTQARSSYVQASSNRAQALYSLLLQHRAISYYRGDIQPQVPSSR